MEPIGYILKTVDGYVAIDVDSGGYPYTYGVKPAQAKIWRNKVEATKYAGIVKLKNYKILTVMIDN